MAVSGSGLATLLFLVFIGPVFYLGQYVYKKSIGKLQAEDPTAVVKEPEDDREELSSNQYLFALIGYAIGTCVSSSYLRAG